MKKDTSMSATDFMTKEYRKDFPLKDGTSPWDSEKPFLKGFFLYAFTNEHGEDWAAYADTNGLIWVSGCDVEWEWKSFVISYNGILFPWVMDQSEQEWLISVGRMAQKRAQTSRKAV